MRPCMGGTVGPVGTLIASEAAGDPHRPTPGHDGPSGGGPVRRRRLRRPAVARRAPLAPPSRGGVGSRRRRRRADVLPGLANRRSWEATLERELARAWRQHLPVSLVVIDLDDFKTLNDREGHLAGDRLLKELSAAWGEVIRDEDVLARPGGDEFG